jgi:limonene-1,2-epoxide hydrolase
MWNAGKVLAVLVTAGILAMTAVEPARADSDAAKIAAVNEMLQAWHDLDWERVYALFTEDGVLHSMMGEPIVGREPIRKPLAPLAADISRIDLKVARIGVVDGLVFVERVDDFDYKGHHGAVPVVGVLEVRDGRIKEWREYYDRAQLLNAMGAAPAPPSATPH